LFKLTCFLVKELRGIKMGSKQQMFHFEAKKVVCSKHFQRFVKTKQNVHVAHSCKTTAPTDKNCGHKSKIHIMSKNYHFPPIFYPLIFDQKHVN
jgi:hypothetical protein